jgi:hypothetical protein
MRFRSRSTSVCRLHVVIVTCAAMSKKSHDASKPVQSFYQDPQDRNGRRCLMRARQCRELVRTGVAVSTYTQRLVCHCDEQELRKQPPLVETHRNLVCLCAFNLTLSLRPCTQGQTVACCSLWVQLEGGVRLRLPPSRTWAPTCSPYRAHQAPGRTFCAPAPSHCVRWKAVPAACSTR